MYMYYIYRYVLCVFFNMWIIVHIYIYTYIMRNYDMYIYTENLSINLSV